MSNSNVEYEYEWSTGLTVLKCHRCININACALKACFCVCIRQRSMDWNGVSAAGWFDRKRGFIQFREHGPAAPWRKGHSLIKTACMCNTMPNPTLLSHTDKWQCQMLENMSARDGWAFRKASIDCAPVSLSDTHLIDVSVWQCRTID